MAGTEKMKIKNILTFCALVLAFGVGASFPLQVTSAQFIDRIIRPCTSGTLRASVIANPLSSGNVEVITCSGGSLTVNGTAVVPGGGTINPTIGIIPYKSGANAFADSPLVRADANTIEQRNGTTAQSFYVYRTFTNTSNYERWTAKWNGTVFEIGNEFTGTGAARQMRFKGANSGTITIDTAANLILSAGTGFGVQNRSWFGAPSDGVIAITNYNEDDIARLCLGPCSVGFPALKRSGAGVILRTGTDSADAAFTASNITASSAFSGPTTGVATNSNAAAGQVGEYLSAQTALNAVALTNNTAASVTSLPLTAGDYDVTVISYFRPAAATVFSTMITSVSLTNNTLDASVGNFAENYFPDNSGDNTQTVANVRISLAAPATVYLVAFASFNTDTMKAGGKIIARRVR